MVCQGYLELVQFIFAVFGALAALRVTVGLISLIHRYALRPSINWADYGSKEKGWAVVTGSTDGIGREFALQFAQKGFNIFIVARNNEKMEAVKAEICKLIYEIFYPVAKSSVQVETFILDFSKATVGDYEKLEQAVKKYPIWVLVNNVGLSHDFPHYFEEESPELIEAMINVNIKGTLAVTRIAQKSMIERSKGMILNVGSFSGGTNKRNQLSSAFPVPLLQVYSGTKAFISFWSQALHAEMKGKGIHVEYLNIYFVKSKMSKIKKTTFLIPGAKDFVRASLKHVGHCSYSTPYPSHALIYEMWKRAPLKIMIQKSFDLTKGQRERALKKTKKTE